MFNFNIKNNNNIEEISDNIASVINEKLRLGKKVLFFTTGGSSIPIEILISKKIINNFFGKLVVTLTDERYGEDNHQESNWFKLINGGFNIKKAKLIPVLCNKNILETTENFKKNLEDELKEADYKIGLFGVGVDSHIAGILPYSKAINTDELACYYDAPPYLRVTITMKTILKLDEAFVFAIDKSKWGVVESFKEDFLIQDKPIQILKNVPLLTIFTDKK